jgi:signal transduction histidine kinase
MAYDPKVLIVDDDQSLCHRLRKFLSNQAAEILTAYDGREALELLRQNEIDLILLDMVMPETGGSQVIDYISSQGLMTSIIVMTGYPSTDSAVESLRKGVYDYLRKPFDLDELTTTVENALNKKRLEYEKEQAEEALRKAHNELERRIEKRTRELTKANEQLRHEIERRKRADQELREAHEELEIRIEERTAELAKANEELRLEISERKRIEEALHDSSEKLKFFAYSVIHDLKSPAIGIYGLTELLHKHYKDALDERGKSYCDQILRASVHVAALIEKINVYITTKESRLKIEKINIKDILQMVRDEFSPRLAVRQIKWVEPDAMVEVKADQLSILRVFRNFVDNALKYGGEELSEIRIGHEESEEFHTFSVSDDGAGIREGDYEKIFAALRRGETYKAVEGLGLGLAIVTEIAKRHGGRVWMEPRGDRLTTFHISLSKDV